MAAFVLFLLKLVVYPVLAIGIVVAAGRLYDALRKGPACTAAPCWARFITGIVTIIGVWLMAQGVPENIHTVVGAVTFAFYLVTVGFGGHWVWQRRDQITAWVKAKFVE